MEQQSRYTPCSRPPPLRLPVVAAILCFTSTAAAHNNVSPPPPATPTPAPAEPKRIGSITVSPFHLLMPIVELTAELQIDPKFGAAGILGYGSVKTTFGEETDRFRAFELGARFNYYLVGTFSRGLQLGFELIYVDFGTNRNVKLLGAANGLAIGPYVGYKRIFDCGFTFEVNAGVQYLESANDRASTAAAKGSRFLPLLNLNVGWSF